jgi:hypothetical protein
MRRASTCALLVACAHALVAPPRRCARNTARRSDPEVTMSDDPLVQRIAAEVAEINNGASMDALLNPAKLINVERELIELRAQRDGGDTSPDVLKAIEKKESVAYVEKRAVMRDWLKALFRGQAYGTIGLSFLLSYDLIPFVDLDLSVRVLGFWSWWLFTVPSLRSIKPLPAPEKKALDAAFLATLVASLLAPFATKDPGAIWWIDATVVAACYGYGYLAPESVEEDDDNAFDSKTGVGGGALGQQLWRSAKWAGRALDYGAGKERGAQSAEASGVEKTLERTVASKAERVAAEDDEAGVEAADGSETYEGYVP